MKKILFTAATEPELACAREAADTLIREGKLPEGNVDFLLTGVGTFQTLSRLLQKLRDCSYDWVVNLGIAGSNDATLELGSVVMIRSEKLADFGVEARGSFSSASAYGLIDANEFPFREGRLITSYGALKQNIALAQYPLVEAMTVDFVTDDLQMNQRRKESTGAVIESMEGAAACYACLLQKVKILEFRAVSNRIGDRNVKNWEFQKCFQNLEKICTEVLQNFMI